MEENLNAQILILGTSNKRTSFVIVEGRAMMGSLPACSKRSWYFHEHNQQRTCNPHNLECGVMMFDGFPVVNSIGLNRKFFLFSQINQFWCIQKTCHSAINRSLQQYHRQRFLQMISKGNKDHKIFQDFHIGCIIM